MKIITSIDDPAIVGRGMGIIAGTLKSQAFDGRITILSAIWTVLFTLATKALSSAPSAGSKILYNLSELSIEDKLSASNEILRLMKDSGVHLTEEESKKIIKEVETYPKQLQQSLKQLYTAFSHYNKT